VIANGGSSNNRESVQNTHEGIRSFWKTTGAASVMIARYLYLRELYKKYTYKGDP
jgi:hypothetical protein